MPNIDIQAGPYRFRGALEHERAPRTCERILSMLPYSSQVIHTRWSGEAVWIPLGDLDLSLEFENHTCHGSRGDFLLYPGGFSETEIVFVYGSFSFASKMGALAGNHFMRLLEGHENLEAFGKLVLWEGAQPLRLSLAAD